MEKKRVSEYDEAAEPDIRDHRRFIERRILIMLEWIRQEPAICLYYDIVLLLSVLLTGLYIFKWRRHFDVHITLVFVLVPIINLGAVLLAHTHSLEAALGVNQLSFVGGCFLQLIIMLAVYSLCQIRFNRLVKVFFFLLSAAIFAFSMTGGRTLADGRPVSDLFYRQVVFEDVNGAGYLVKEYGPLHTVFYAVVIIYFLMSLGTIVYTFFRKKQVSRKILLLLFLPECVAMFAFFAGRQLIHGIELLPAAYVFAQVMYLVIISRISLYDITETAVDSLVQTGETGLISFDFGQHYLGSNETAKTVFPALNNLTVDRSVQHSKSFSELVVPWLETFRANETRNTAHYEKDSRFYQVIISWLYNGRKRQGYQLAVRDDTKGQKYIRLMHQFNNSLQQEVDEKTAHLVEMHDRLILSMATMVESRDNSTGGHIRRTSEGVRILLKAMGDEWNLSDSFRRNLIKAAPMHDLGKIAVDDVVLRKPGRFTPEEYEIMKRHAPEGARIVHEILKDTDDDEFHILAENVAHYHHERWDGKGYPEGLSGEAIPPEARIMAVADVYDALVSKRVYKDKMSFEKADEIMMEGMGSQFAPEMKDVYMRARPDLEAYYLSLE